MAACVFSFFLTILCVGLYGKYAYADWCDLVVSPPFLLVEYGSPAEVNCSIANTSQTLNNYRLGWESKILEIATNNERSVMWRVKSLTTWEEDSIVCYLSVNRPLCETEVDIIMYKRPDSVTLSSVSDVWVNGDQTQLRCEIENVGPGRKLSVHWSRADLNQNTFTQFGETLFPDLVNEKESVNVTAYLNVTPSREDDGAQYQCAAVLNLDQQLIMTSQPITITVHSCGVIVRDRGKRDSNDLLSCPHYPLQGLAIRDGASPKPGSDAAAQDALDGPSVEHGQDWGREMGFPQPPQEVETLLGFLGDGAGVERPGEVLRQVDTEEFGALDDLHIGPVDVQWRVVTLCSPEVKNHLFSLVDIQRQVVVFTPGRCTSSLYADSWFLLMRPTTAVSSVNLRMWLELCIAAQSTWTDWCDHLVVSSPFLLVEYGSPAEVNCSIANTSQTLNTYQLGWESKIQQPSTNNERSVMWRVKSLTTWQEDQIMCYLSVGGTSCETEVDIIMYKRPDSVTLSSVSDVWVNGDQTQLRCEIENVGPGRKLSVHWSRADLNQNTFIQFNETLFPDLVNEKESVNVTAYLNVTPSREDDGAQYQCAAVLNLDQQLIMTSQPITITVHSGQLSLITIWMVIAIALIVAVVIFQCCIYFQYRHMGRANWSI
ncbi:hypothetical protein QTP86_013900 [Hemibagrus guttatus]|nr:hypothetical protein QTP86_013900 [Hemibagrus guttatus]